MTIADINTLARTLTKTTTTTYSAANLLIAVNNAYERITGKLIKETAGGTWPYGDANYTAFPTYTQNLVNSQAEYQIDSLTGPITIMGAEVLDNNNIWHPLSRISLKDIRKTGIAQAEWYKTDGLPIQYEPREFEIVLYPAPDNGVSVTLTSGLKIFFLRTADVFTSAQVTTGTKTPGFPSPYHHILAYEAAYTYAVANNLPNLALLKNEVDRLEIDLIAFVCKSDSDAPKRLSTKRIGHR